MFFLWPYILLGGIIAMMIRIFIIYLLIYGLLINWGAHELETLWIKRLMRPAAMIEKKLNLTTRFRDQDIHVGCLIVSLVAMVIFRFL
ncbi:MAG: hypothetical protein ACRC6X_04405 [Culicoidibacterales bacterium]